MTEHAGASQAFFLDSVPGQRFCLLFTPTPDVACRGTVLYIPPFAEEMNKSRQIAARQARLLAQLGYAVLSMDLYGCGDSSGDFGDARWEIWLSDLLRAAYWLQQTIGKPLSVIGLRLGALLALQLTATLQRAGTPLQRLLLWQPVLQGAPYLTQFLRLRLAADLLAAPHSNAAEAAGTAATRRLLAAGEAVEIAGYLLAPELAAALDAQDARRQAPVGLPLHWLECVADEHAQIAPARQNIIADWRRQGVDLQIMDVTCEPFWASPEICSAPALLAATSEIFHAAGGSRHVTA